MQKLTILLCFILIVSCSEKKSKEIKQTIQEVITPPPLLSISQNKTLNYKGQAIYTADSETKKIDIIKEKLTINSNFFYLIEEQLKNIKCEYKYRVLKVLKKSNHYKLSKPFGNCERIKYFLSEKKVPVSKYKITSDFLFFTNSDNNVSLVIVFLKKKFLLEIKFDVKIV